MELNTNEITPVIIVSESRHMPGVEVIEIPGLGYWSSLEAAQEALDKLAQGQCPMTHKIDDLLEPRVCRICGRFEQVGDFDDADEDNEPGS